MKENYGGRVTAIIPARNEEANIARVVRSVAAQEGILEVLVVDDQSQDWTGEILNELKAEIPALRTIRIDRLPEGWTGKSHAVTTAARMAVGDWLLFTDADTEHLPGSLAALLERAQREGVDLLSVSPGQRTPTWWEKAVIPLVYVHLARLYRFEDVSDPQSPAAAANGQYILIRREVYERAGGHEAVHGEILEDVELARRVKAAGGPSAAKSLPRARPAICSAAAVARISRARSGSAGSAGGAGFAGSDSNSVGSNQTKWHFRQTSRRGALGPSVETSTMGARQDGQSRRSGPRRPRAFSHSRVTTSSVSALRSTPTPTARPPQDGQDQEMPCGPLVRVRSVWSFGQTNTL